jgi:hypothetical protein
MESGRPENGIAHRCYVEAAAVRDRLAPVPRRQNLIARMMSWMARRPLAHRSGARARIGGEHALPR